MRKSIFFGAFVALAFPGVLHAATCTVNGYTVIYVNGIFASSTSASGDAKELGGRLPRTFNGESLVAKPANNPSKLGGVDDLLKTMRQIQFWDDSTFHQDTDVDTILDEIYSELTTQKVLLVGHSQGAFYTNDIYYYLISHGMSPRAVGVYNLASPADRVAGDGYYETSFNDSVIKSIRNDVLNKPYYFGLNLPMAPNFIAATSTDDSTGHLFVPSYLNAEPDTIVGDIEQSLSRLQPSYAYDVNQPCFDPPVHSAKETIGIAVTDHAISAAEGAYFLAAGSAYGVALALHNTGAFVASIVGAFGPSPQQTAKNDQGVSDATVGLLNSLNLSSLTPKVNEELRKPGIEDLGAAAVLAVLPGKKATTTPPGEVLGVATDTLPVAITTPSSTPALSVPIPTPSPAVGLVSHSDGQGASPAAAVDDSTTTLASSTPVFGAPQHIVISNWHAAAVNINRNEAEYCGSATPAVDVAWDSVPSAVEYYLWRQDGSGERLLRTTVIPSATDVGFDYDINAANQINLEVVAADGSGNFATSSISLDSANPHEPALEVESTVPAWGSRGVSSTTPIQIIYNHAIDPASLTSYSRAFALTIMSGGSTLLDATWSIEGDGRTIDVTPVDPLLPDSDYVAVVLCGVEDLYGNHGNSLAGPVTSPQFITGN